MPSNGDLGARLGIPAKVYPGMFERECQATVDVDGDLITVVVSPDFTLVTGPVSEEGSEGMLIVSIVDATEKDYLVDLPGETLGKSRRLRVPKGLGQPVPGT